MNHNKSGWGVKWTLNIWNTMFNNNNNNGQSWCEGQNAEQFIVTKKEGGCLI